MACQDKVSPLLGWVLCIKEEGVTISGIQGRLGEMTGGTGKVGIKLGRIKNSNVESLNLNFFLAFGQYC